MKILIGCVLLVALFSTCYVHTEDNSIDANPEYYQEINQEYPQELMCNCNWKTVLKKHGYSALIGLVLGAVCGIADSQSEKLTLVKDNYQLKLHWLLFGGVKYVVLYAIAQDAIRYKLEEYNLLTASSIALLSDWITYCFFEKMSIQGK